ncbi:hypothetical protein CEXT_17801 [Caerostris extrusa]|uniref:Uncharacterized protein n=1 Tax=Caerostris extrusa TaxID=172846 RepID=A0AAV4Q1H7_CAEEX|nr:hypothetical protein CEXT_17801 [Caerostris extrusa]
MVTEAPLALLAFDTTSFQFGGCSKDSSDCEPDPSDLLHDISLLPSLSPSSSSSISSREVSLLGYSQTQ